MKVGRIGVGRREAIASPTATVFVSAASIREIAIKATLGKLALGDSDVTAIALTFNIDRRLQD